MLGFALADCNDIVNQPTPSFARIDMALTSNIPETTFCFRERRVDSDPYDRWETIGVGTKVVVSLPEQGRFEVSATPPNYSTKYIKLAEPVKRFEFHFVDADRTTYFAPDRGFVSCDVRVLRVSDGAVIAGASGAGKAEQLEKIANDLANHLLEDGDVAGQAIAVFTLRNRTGAPAGKRVATELADKLVNSLVRTGVSDVRERIDLSAIEDEFDLESVGIVQSPRVRSRLAAVELVIIGGVTYQPDLPK